MKKVIFGIFAHPDDEAFGPSGTLLVEKAAGNEVHLICATAGENGINPDNAIDLAAVRLQEWRQATELIGADSIHYLGYEDGTLQNNYYMEIAEKVTAIVSEVIADRNDIEIEFMSMDLNGITGHIDHICIARVACYVYCNLKDTDKRVTRMRLACITRQEAPRVNCDWLYMEAGRADDEVHEIVDASAHLDTIKDIMHVHHTQRKDADAHLEKMGDAIALNRFLVL